MSSIQLGRRVNGRGVVTLDLDVLLRTRLLLQANSGGGKSWALRRLSEQLFGKVPVIILDPEGEFATLRERFGYVLVGKGGETPVDTRSAALVAHKLLELRASAVCDLYESKPSERHAWVRLFLEALIDAPKRLWRPLIVVVDEAHLFCPEKGAGESEASDAMIGLTTRGRKRGFCAVWATQRLGKLRKDAAAELQNVLIGPTFMDIDRERAADALGVPRAERAAFFDQIKVVEPGHFWALGRAIALERVMVRVGEVLTTHPEPGSTKHAAEPPPPPEKVRALLPQLADLPKEAERKALTEAELRRRIRELEAEVRQARAAQPAPAPATRVEVPVLSEQHVKRLEAVALKISTAGERLATLGPAVQQAAAEITAALRARNQVTQPPVGARTTLIRHQQAGATPARVLQQPTAIMVSRRTEPTEGLTGPEQRILDALAWLEAIGVPEPEQAAVAFLAGYTIGGGAFNNPRGALRTKGLIAYRGDRLALTDEGRRRARAPAAALTTEELHRRILDRLPGPERKILAVVLEAYPKAVENDELARRAGYEPGGGAFNNPRGRLRSLGLVTYPERGLVRASDALFLP